MDIPHEDMKRIEAAVKDGAVFSVLYFDLHGKGKDRLKEIGTGFVATLLKFPGVLFAYGEIEEPIEDNGLHSAGIEVKVLTKDFPTLARLCADYSPYSLEILKPLEITLSLGDAHELLMDISTTTFNYKKYIVEKVGDEHDKKVHASVVKNREQLGKSLLKSAKGKA